MVHGAIKSGMQCNSTFRFWFRKHLLFWCFRILFPPLSNPPFYQSRIPDPIIFINTLLTRTIFIKSNIYLQAQFILHCGRKVLKNNSIAFPDLIKVQKIYFILTRFYVTTRYPDLHSAFPVMTKKWFENIGFFHEFHW